MNNDKDFQCLFKGRFQNDSDGNGQCTYPRFPEYFFNQYSKEDYFLATGYFPSKTIVETVVRGEKEMNLVAMTIINPRNEIGRAGDRTTDSLFSIPAHYRLSYHQEK